METATMGKVIVEATLENLADLYKANEGRITADQVRRVVVTDALVDTGAVGLLAPKRIIEQLGLNLVRTKRARGIGGTVEMPIYDAVRITINGRDCVIDVGEVSDDFPVLIGQIPLEAMDWVVDPSRQRLIGNPEHGGEHIIDVF